MPIVQVDGRTIGDGLVGLITKTLLAEYRRQAEAISVSRP